MTTIKNKILVPRNLDSREEQRKRIDYQRIQEYIKKGSNGYLDLEGTPLTKLPDNLTRVGGTLYVNTSDIEDLNNLEYVGGGIWANNSKLKSLPPKLTKIRGNLCLDKCPIDNINNIKYIGGMLSIGHTNINELPEGLDIMGSLHGGFNPLIDRYHNENLLREYLKERNIKVLLTSGYRGIDLK